MNRHDIVAKLTDLAGPLGPATSYAKRRDEQDQWADAGGAALFDALLELLVGGPIDATFGAALADNVEVLVVEVLGRIGASDPTRALDGIRDLLDVTWARGVAIDVLGSLGDPAAVAALMALHQRERLDEATRVRVASAVGEIGGAPAMTALAALADSAQPGENALAREIALARELAGQRA